MGPQALDDLKEIRPAFVDRVGPLDDRRLACGQGSNDKMWAELFLWNKDNLISEIDMFSDALANMRQKLVDDDREGLEKMFRLSTERRKAFDKK